MDLLVELVPAIGTIIGLVIVSLLAKYGVNLNKQATVSTTIMAIDKLMEIFGLVEEQSAKNGTKGKVKLEDAIEIAKLTLDKKELRAIEALGAKAIKDPLKDTKDSFGDKLKAGVQDVFITSVGMLAKNKLGAFIKKI